MKGTRKVGDFVYSYVNFILNSRTISQLYEKVAIVSCEAEDSRWYH